MFTWLQRILPFPATRDCRSPTSEDGGRNGNEYVREDLLDTVGLED